MHYRIAAALLLAALPAVGCAQTPRPAAQPAQGVEDARLMAVFQDDSRREDSFNPFALLYRGGSADPALLRKVFSDAQVDAERKAVAASLAALSRINRARLSPDRQISYDVFLGDKRIQSAWLQPDMQALTAVLPFNHFGGLHVEFPTLVAKGGALSWDDAEDYRRNLELIRAFPQVLDNAVLRFRKGLETGVVDTRLTTTNMIAQIDALLAQKAEETPFYSALREPPSGIPADARDHLRAQYLAAIRDEIHPAYRRLRDFLNTEYLPAAREQVGLAAMKGGPGLYRKLIERHSTLRLEPEAIHQLGLGEVARIQGEMERVKLRLGFNGSLKAFFEEIRTNPRYHPKTREELAQGFAQAAREVEGLVPQYFLRLPRTRLEIQPYPAYREQYEAGGSYDQGSPDGSRPGTFYYNTYDLPSRFLTGINTLYLHEGAPGHHFQISLAQEDSTLPDFQRFGGNTAYVEGWALYAETLGYPMGLFKDPMQHWGTLDDEMLRAMRLVVDTGLHAKGWSRDQAIAYMLANSGMGRTDATAEVERYIAWPGQAVSYKLGALTIQRLRKRAEDQLGPKFDLREFHAQVLGSGALPLPVLEAKIERWIENQAKASAISSRVLAIP